MKLFKTIFLTLFVAVSLCATAQVKNMALQLERGAYVECGQLPALDNLESYTIQLWYKISDPASIEYPATLLSRGPQKGADGISVVLTAEGAVFSVGSTTLTASADLLDPSMWHQLTLICDKGDARLLVDGAEAKTGSLSATPAASEEFLYLGGDNFAGMIDDVRIWNDALIPDYDYYVNTTLNEFNPQVDNLLVYYKLDQADCPDVVNYKAIWAKETSNANHGLMSLSGAKKVPVTDNDKLPYLINSAYTANERFWDRDVSRGQYLVSNDIIMLGIQSYNDGHLKYVTPNCHATLENCNYLAEFDGREGVIEFKGDGKMTLSKDAFQPSSVSGYTFETFFYIDEWVEGAVIMRQETADKQAGISIELSDEASQAIKVRVNGKEFTRMLGTPQKQGRWVHFAMIPDVTATQPKTSFTFFLNGNGLAATTAPDEIINMPAGAEECEVVIGENFKGKLDETATWSKTWSSADFKSHMNNGLPLPAIGKIITADPMFYALCYLKYDDASNPGWDSYSQDNWLKIIEGAFDGYTGYNIRISVKSHSGWQNTISTEEKRLIFAKDLAELSKPYAGVELDLEWAESAYDMSKLAALCKTIRENLPEDKTFFLSCHCYSATFQVPTTHMQYLDGFTFQVYGPQSSWFKYSTFLDCANKFIKWGFPKEKIMMAYSTTTSGGYNGGSLSTYAIKGVKDGFMPDSYVPNGEEESAEFSGLRYWFTGTLQTYRRAKYCVDNNLQGIFYWDMGNDMPFDSGKNLARISSYAMCGNVDPYVTEVVRPQSGIVSPVIDNAANQGYITLEAGIVSALFNDGERVSKISVYAADGREITSSNASKVNVSVLSVGAYIVKAFGENGTSAVAKIVIR